MHTITDIERITGISEIQLTRAGKWLVMDQRGSKGAMNDAVSALKKAGVPAFFSASQRKFGVLAEAVDTASEPTADESATAAVEPATAKQIAFCERLWNEGRAPYAFAEVNVRGGLTRAAASAYIERFKNCRRTRDTEQPVAHKMANGHSWLEY